MCRLWWPSEVVAQSGVSLRMGHRRVISQSDGNETWEQVDDSPCSFYNLSTEGGVIPMVRRWLKYREPLLDNNRCFHHNTYHHDISSSHWPVKAWDDGWQQTNWSSIHSLHLFIITERETLQLLGDASKTFLSQELDNNNNMTTMSENYRQHGKKE